MPPSSSVDRPTFWKMMATVPVFDIKPYVPYADSVPDAVDAFAGVRQAEPLRVIFPEPWRGMIAPEKLEGLVQALSLTAGPLLLKDVTLLGAIGSALILANDSARRIYYVCAEDVEFLG